MSRQVTESPEASAAAECTIDILYQRFSQLSFSNTKSITSFCFLVMNINDQVSDDEMVSRVVASLKLALYKEVEVSDLLPLLAWFRVANFTDHEIVENLKQQLESHPDSHCQLLLKIARQHKLDNTLPLYRGIGDVNLFGETREQVFPLLSFTEEQKKQIASEQLEMPTSFEPVIIDEKFSEQVCIHFSDIEPCIDRYWELFGCDLLIIMGSSRYVDLVRFLVEKIDQNAFTYHQWFSWLSQMPLEMIEVFFREILFVLKDRDEIVDSIQKTPLLLFMLYQVIKNPRLNYNQVAQTICNSLTEAQVRLLIDTNAFTGVKKLYLMCQFYISLKTSLNKRKRLDSCHQSNVIALLRRAIVDLLMDVAQETDPSSWPRDYEKILKDCDVSIEFKHRLSIWHDVYQEAADFNALYDLWISHENERAVIKILALSFRYQEIPFTFHELVAFYFKQQFNTDPESFVIEKIWKQIALQYFPYLLPVESDTPEGLNTKSKALSGHFRKALVAAFEGATTRNYQEVVLEALEGQMAAQQRLLDESAKSSYFFSEKVQWWSETAWWDTHEHPINNCILRDNEAGLAYLYHVAHRHISDTALELATRFGNVKILDFLVQLPRIQQQDIRNFFAILIGVGLAKMWTYLEAPYLKQIIQCVDGHELMTQITKKEFSVGFSLLLNQAIVDKAIGAVEGLLSFLFYFQLSSKLSKDAVNDFFINAFEIGSKKIIDLLMPLKNRLSAAFLFTHLRTCIEKKMFSQADILIQYIIDEYSVKTIVFNLFDVDRQCEISLYLCKYFLTSFLRSKVLTEQEYLLILKECMKTLSASELTEILDAIWQYMKISNELLEKEMRGTHVPVNKKQVALFVYQHKSGQMSIESTAAYYDNNYIVEVLVWCLILEDYAIFDYNFQRLGKELSIDITVDFLMFVINARQLNSVKSLIDMAIANNKGDIVKLSITALTVSCRFNDIKWLRENINNYKVLPEKDFLGRARYISQLSCDGGDVSIVMKIRSEYPQHITSWVSLADLSQNNFIQGFCGCKNTRDESILVSNRVMLLNNFKKFYQYLSRKPLGFGVQLFKSQRWDNATTDDLGEIIFYALSNPDSQTATVVNLLYHYYQNHKRNAYHLSDNLQNDVLVKKLCRHWEEMDEERVSREGKVFKTSFII